MDCVYSGWTTDRSEGFSDSRHAGVATALLPYLALAMKGASLARMTKTLMETYLGRDAGRLVLEGRIARGVADRIDAALWFSDLRGYTKITDTSPPEQIIPLLNDYAEAAISAIHEHGGDVLKLIGDGVLAIFRADDPRAACKPRRITAADRGRKAIAVLNDAPRQLKELPTTDMYLRAAYRARCSSAISAARIGSISPSSGRRSTRPAASPPCAAPSTGRCWFRRALPPAWG